MPKGFLALCLLIAGSAAAEQPLTIQQSFPFPATGQLVAAPSETQVARVARVESGVYTQKHQDDRWLSHQADLGFLGRVDAPAPRGVGWRGSGWAQAQECEAMYPSLADPVGLCVRGDTLEELTTPHPVPISPVAPGTGRLPEPWQIPPGEGPAYLARAYETLVRQAGTLRTQRGVRLESPLPETLYELQDVSLNALRMLCRPREEDLLVSLNLLSGERSVFTLHERPRALPGDATGAFSPGGSHVLVLFSYHPDDHFSGGYLQLFTADGHYIEEVAQLPENAYSRSAFLRWLSNGWIVYGDGNQLHFAAFSL